MNTVQLECFLAVAEYLNFAKSSEKMNISQPAVTHQIKTLEDELGAKLFNRTTRTVELTTEGLAFLEDAKNIVNIARHAIHRFENPRDADILNFNIGCTGLSQMELLPDVLEPLSEKYPNIHPQIMVNPSMQLMNEVEEGAVDVTFGMKNTSYTKNILKYRELCKVPIVCIHRDDHLLMEKDKIKMEDIKKHSLILYNPGCAVPDVSKIQWGLMQGKKVSELYFCENMDSAIMMVKSGFGVAIIPDIFVPEHEGLTKKIPEDTVMLSFGVYYKNTKVSPVLNDFIHLMKEFLTK